MPTEDLLLRDRWIREHRAAELALPAHLLWVMTDDVRKKGWIPRADVFEHLNRGAAAALNGLDQVSIPRVAKRIDDLARDILREMHFDDERDGLISCAMLVSKLVEERLYPDTTNQAVLVSLLLIDDAMDAGSELPFNEARIKQNVGRMLSKLATAGYYRIGHPAGHTP